MQAIRINQWGEALQLEEIPKPEPGPGEVLVRVRAASLNPIDSIVAVGALQSMLSAPMTSGTDFAGDVEAVGPGVDHVQPGDAVFGMIPLRGGAFAEYAIARSNEVALKPRTLDYTHAAAAPLTGITAWQSVIDAAQLQAGEDVLILGAAGGVGSIAVQLAKARGAHVIASDRAHKASYLRALGADETIDLQPDASADAGEQVDVVLNYASGDLAAAAIGRLRSGGRYVTPMQAPDSAETERRGIQTIVMFAQPTAAHLAELADTLDKGAARVTVRQTFALRDVQAAMAQRRQSGTPGKIVLTID